MRKKIDLTGQRFGRWTVLEEAGQDERKQVLWRCQCDCGNVKIIYGSCLRRGNSQSCGCLQIERARAKNTKHGMKGTPTYISWRSMLNRCNNPKADSYVYYGNKGITVCNHWLKFENFFADMGVRPDGLTIDRANNNLGYFKGNCRWATATQQQRNKRVQKRNNTGYTGVAWVKQRCKYRVGIKANCKQYFIGHYDKLKEAIRARKQAELKFWGEGSCRYIALNAGIVKI